MRRATLATATALLSASLLLSVPLAAATYDPLASGATELSLDSSFRTLLGRNGVKLQGREGVKVSAKAVTFPVSGGKFDPLTSNGTVEHGGALIFTAGARKVALGALQLKTTQRRAPLSAKVGGGQLKLATAAKLTVTRRGFGEKTKASTLVLSVKFAERLGKRLHLGGVFAAGQPLGSVLTTTQPATVAILPSGRATLTPDPAFLAKLNSLFVSLNPISPAELAPGPLFSFPIAPEGAIAPDASAGTLRTGGALEFLQLGGGQVFTHEPWLDLGAHSLTAELDVQPSPPYPGKVGRLGILDLAGGAGSSDPAARTIGLSGAQLTLQGLAASAFNQAFAAGKEVFRAGELLGTLSFVAQGQ